MQRFLSSLVAAILAVHMVFGCCWHHVHADDPCTTESSHDDGHQDHGRPEKPDCREQHCVFVRPAKVLANELVAPVVQQAAFSPCDDFSSCDRFAAEFLYSPGSLPPPLRLHLIERVLLI